MIVKNKEGRKIEIMLIGDYEMPEVDEAYYLDSEEDVTQDDIEYILGTYDAEVHEHLVGRQYGMDEYYKMGA